MAEWNLRLPEIKGPLVAGIVALFSISGYAGATYLQVEHQFDEESKAFDLIDKRFSLIEQRLDQDEKATVDRATDQRGHDEKVSESLGKISDALNSLSVLVAASGSHVTRR
jgi:hypothetical protein